MKRCAEITRLAAAEDPHADYLSGFQGVERGAHPVVVLHPDDGDSLDGENDVTAQPNLLLADRGGNGGDEL